ncbi:major capsid protein P2 [Photobacterium satsumensis]|uniref:major capsid protein P2 n=1 Tax=Photobacterium satsumensis TaxID=2910239 RepID=UPI003D0975CF
MSAKTKGYVITGVIAAGAVVWASNNVDAVEVSLNGSAKINVTGETLVKLQAHRKNYAQDGRYIISFGDATHL